MTITYDLALFQPGTTYESSLISIPTGGRKITSSEKLGQRFLVELMTPRGSLKFHPSRGTDFVNTVGSGSALSELDVLSAFSQALLDIGVNLQSEDNAGSYPLSEQFGGARLTSFTIMNDVVLIDVIIASLDGGISNLSIPVQF